MSALTKPIALDETLQRVANALEEISETTGDQKADKVHNAVSGNFAGLDETGNLTDSGHKPSDFLTAEDIVGKLDAPEGTGTVGQSPRIASGGGMEWASVGAPTDAQVETAVSDWLNAHPEATTTVEDGSITKVKLDSSLQQTVDEVGDLKSAIGALNNAVVYEYDLASETTIGFNIAPSTGKWVSGSNYDCYYFEVPTGAEFVKIKSNATNGTVYALLSASDTHTHGQVPSYATGCTRTFVEAGNEKDIIIPDDCKYIWVTKTLGGTNYAPQFLGFNVSLLEIESEINEISTSNVNLWTGESTISFTKSKTVPFSPALPAGTYNLSAVVTSNDTDYTYCRASIGGQTVDLTRGTRANNSFTLSSPASSITFYASRNDSYSTGDTATWADIQIEKGIYASNYEPHKMVAYDETARRMVNRIVKYVATTGNDNNDGNTVQTPYATIGKAISETPDIIYVAKGTYTEAQIYENTKLRYSGIKIICDNATLIMPVSGIQFRYANVDISGLTVDVTNASSESSYGFLLLNCTGKMTDCTAIGAKGAGGFRLDGSRVTLTRCVVANCAIDGFNGHTINTGYETEATLIDCIAHNCGDDGASIHESGKMYVIGGEYYNNVQTGLAPHDLCVFEALNVHCHNNGIGIEAVKDTLSTGETPAVGRVIGCILDHNTTYGLDVKNYTVNALGNAYANNGTGKTRTGTGATINAFTAD